MTGRSNKNKPKKILLIHFSTLRVNIAGYLFRLFQILTKAQQIAVRILHQKLPLAGNCPAGVVMGIP